MDIIATICNTVTYRVFSFVGAPSPRVPFYMALARLPEIVGIPPLPPMTLVSMFLARFVATGWVRDGRIQPPAVRVFPSKSI